MISGEPLSHPLTILHTESSLGWGGQEIRTLKEGLILSQRGYRICYACNPESGLYRHAKNAGLEVFPLIIKNAFDFHALFQLRTLIHQIKPDVVNTHSGHDSIIGGIAARLSKVKPIVLRSRHLILPITSKITYSVLPHHLIVDSQATQISLAHQGIDPARISVIPTGFDPCVFDKTKHNRQTFRTELGIDDDVPLIGNIAILRLKKGHRYFIEAIPEILSRFPKAQFVIVGNGPQYDELKALIEKKALTHTVTGRFSVVYNNLNPAATAASI